MFATTNASTSFSSDIGFMNSVGLAGYINKNSGSIYYVLFGAREHNFKNGNVMSVIQEPGCTEVYKWDTKTNCRSRSVIVCQVSSFHAVAPGGGYSTKFYMGRLPPRGPTPYTFIYHF